VYVNISQLNLRAKASPEATIVVTLKFGDAVERTGVSTTKDENGYEWSRLLYNGQVCYANSLYLSTTQSISETIVFETKTDVVYTTAEVAVNLREDASSTSTIVASVGYGTRLERTGVATTADSEGITWSRVSFNGKICYVTTSYLTTTPIVTIEEADETVYVTADSLNMRSIPSFEGSVLRSLKKGTELHCTGKANMADGDGITWYKVEVDGVIGYASALYLSPEKPA
ncbi:MAG: SH3 domain-containing protein, partial [Clostridia bacterium]|nr:SH3 domain-containing protein [Clostridia bacterium]